MKECAEGRRLAELSIAVRGSSLERLRQVPPGREGWRIHPQALSFADLAHHLIEADLWLFAKLDDPQLEPMVAHCGEAPEGWDAYHGMLDELEALGRRRAELLAGLSDERLEERIPDARLTKEDGDTVTVWWVIVRGNLDHEIHHRGQIALYLALVATKAR